MSEEIEEKSEFQKTSEALEKALAPTDPQYEALMLECPQVAFDGDKGILVDTKKECLILNGIDVLPEVENPTINSFLTVAERKIIVRSLIDLDFINPFHPYNIKNVAKKKMAELFNIEEDSKLVEHAVDYIKELAKFINIEFNFTDEKDNSIVLRLVGATPNIYDFTLTQRRNLLKMAIPDTDVIRFEKALKFLNSIVLNHNSKKQREFESRMKKAAENSADKVSDEPKKYSSEFKSYSFDKDTKDVNRLPTHQEELANRNNNEVDSFIEYICDTVNPLLAKDLRDIRAAKNAYERLHQYGKQQTRAGAKLVDGVWCKDGVIG